MKHNLRLAAAAVLALGLVLAAVPVVNSAEFKAPRMSFVQIVKLPALLVPSMMRLPAVDETLIAVPAQPPSTSKVRPTDDIQIPKVGSGN